MGSCSYLDLLLVARTLPTPAARLPAKRLIADLSGQVQENCPPFAT